jgi:hypothetical protein
LDEQEYSLECLSFSKEAFREPFTLWWSTIHVFGFKCKRATNGHIQYKYHILEKWIMWHIFLFSDKYNSVNILQKTPMLNLSWGLCHLWFIIAIIHKMLSRTKWDYIRQKKRDYKTYFTNATMATCGILKFVFIFAERHIFTWSL